MSATSAPNEIERHAYYRGALRGLRFVESRSPTGRRFGADADVVWGHLRGELEVIDRLDLLVRDADVQWPGAFAARRVFDLRGVAEDDPFGAAWAGLDPKLGVALWRAPEGIDELGALFGAVADAWSHDLSGVELPAIHATTRLLLVGPGAIAEAALAFAEGEGLDWSAQVVVVARRPLARQLAAMAAALLDCGRATPLLALDGEGPQLGGYRIVASEDAEPEALDRARALLKGDRGQAR